MSRRARLSFVGRGQTFEEGDENAQVTLQKVVGRVQVLGQFSHPVQAQVKRIQVAHDVTELQVVG